jgi:lysozyme
MKASEKCLELIKHYEGMSLSPYLCPANVVTIGYGTVIRDQYGNALKGEQGMQDAMRWYHELAKITPADADRFLANLMPIYEGMVMDNLQVKQEQHQFDALVSHAYNCGISENLYRLINDNAPLDKITEWFETKYITAKGKVLRGLVKRRKSESVLYSSGELVLY